MQGPRFLQTFRSPRHDYRIWGQIAPDVDTMDPISLAASIIAIVGASVKTAQGLQKLHEMHNAPAEVAELANEITDIELVFRTIHELVAKNLVDDIDIQEAKALLSLLGKANDILSQLEVIQGKIQSGAGKPGSEKRPPGSISKYAWMKERRKALALYQRLKETRQNLQTAMSALTCSQMRTVPATYLTIQASVSQLEQTFSTRLDLIQEQLSTKHTLSDTPCPQPTTDDPSRPPPYNATTPTPSKWVSITGHQVLHKCDRACPCQCHIRSTVSTPTWLRTVVGSLFLSYAGSPSWRTQPCNYAPCKKTSCAGVSYTYHFPSWMVARSVSFSLLSRGGLHGAGGSWTLHIPKVLADEEPVWRFLNYGTVGQVSEILGKRIVSACDMNKDGKTLLHFAVEYERPDMVKFLIREGVNTSFQDNAGSTAPMMAMEKVVPTTAGATRALKVRDLQRIFNDEDQQESYQFSPLHLCVLRLPEEAFPTQLDLNFASKDAQDAFGRTPLMWATALNKPVAARALLEHGASTSLADRNSKTALHWAMVSQSLEIAKLLLGAGAGLEARDIFGRTPLHEVAKVPGSESLIHALLDHGADIDAEDYFYKRTPMHLAAYHGRAENVRAMAERGANIDAMMEPVLRTPLLQAIWYNRAPTVEALLNLGADIASVDASERGILHLAAIFGSARIMEALASAVRSAKTSRLDCLGVDKDDSTPYGCFVRLRGERYHGEVLPDDGDRKAFERLLETVREVTMGEGEEGEQGKEGLGVKEWKRRVEVTLQEVVVA